MSTLNIRLPKQLDANLNEESRLAGQPKSLLVRLALERFLEDRRHERLLARFSRAASAIAGHNAKALAEEALRIDNEALALTETNRPASQPDSSENPS